MKLRAIQLLSRYIGILLVWLFGRIGAEVAPEQITGTSELIATGVGGVLFLLVDHYLHKVNWDKVKLYLPVDPWSKQ